MKLLVQAETLASVVPFSEQAGYPATNLLTPSVTRRWLATSASGWFRAQRLASTGIHVGMQGLQNQCNNTYISTGATTSVSPIPGAIVPAHTDGAGRRKGNLALPTANTYLVFNFLAPGGVPCGLSSIYFFKSAIALPDALLRSETRIEYPQADIALPNGVQFPVDQGPPRTRITLRWRRPRANDIEEVARLARAGICWLDLENPDAPWMQWPVRFIGSSIGRQLSGAREDEATLEFVEVV